jgi:hypothetical protein
MPDPNQPVDHAVVLRLLPNSSSKTRFHAPPGPLGSGAPGGLGVDFASGVGVAEGLTGDVAEGADDGVDVCVAEAFSPGETSGDVPNAVDASACLRLPVCLCTMGALTCVGPPYECAGLFEEDISAVVASAAKPTQNEDAIRCRNIGAPVKRYKGSNSLWAPAKAHIPEGTNSSQRHHKKVLSVAMDEDVLPDAARVMPPGV